MTSVINVQMNDLELNAQAVKNKQILDGFKL